MSIITLDFETFYDKDYSLSKMTVEEYINDPRFEVIGYGIKVDSRPTEWVSGDVGTLKEQLSTWDWGRSILICHNTIFDGAILHWRFGISPNMYADTMAMARALNGPDFSVSLANLANYYKVGTKGDEVVRAVGKRRRDFTPVELKNYGAYCKNDTELTYALFKAMAQDFPASEMELVDLTLRMFIQPSLRINNVILKERLHEIMVEKAALLSGLKKELNCSTEEEVRSILASSNKFVQVLKNHAIPIPFKENAKGQPIPALARTDLGFIALEEHPDPFVQQICAARLGTKSTIEESRVARFIEVEQRNKGLLPVPLKYYAAHSGRWGGTDGINLQNLPSRDKRKKTLKTSIEAPPGYALVHADLSQIEARILAWLAGQNDVIEAFKSGRDIYCEDATKAFGRPITKADVKARFIGKTMRLGLGYGTGANKLQRALSIGGAELSLGDCVGLVQNWRINNARITELWRDGDRLLKQLMAWPEDGHSFYFGEHELLAVTPYGINLPNGLYIRYHNLRLGPKKNIQHDSRKGPVDIWGGVCVENVTQALARIVISDYMIKIKPRYTIALTVHDSILLVVCNEELDEAVKFVDDTMSTPPTWAPGLPVACDIKTGSNYGEC